MKGRVALYCSVDDFLRFFKNQWNKRLISRTWPHRPDPELSTHSRSPPKKRTELKVLAIELF